LRLSVKIELTRHGDRGPPPTRDEAEALRRIARWRSALLVMWATTFLVIPAALYAWPGGAFAVVAAWFALLMFLGFTRARGPCPRCKQRFPVREYGRTPWENGCMHCGLRVAPNEVRGAPEGE
jgi:hypothetical protein